MKSLLVRLTILAAIIALGTLAVGQVQFGFGRASADKQSVKSPPRRATAEPIPLAEQSDDIPTAEDPFTGRDPSRVIPHSGGPRDLENTTNTSAEAPSNPRAAMQDDIPPADQVAPARYGSPNGENAEPRALRVQDGEPIASQARQLQRSSVSGRNPDGRNEPNADRYADRYSQRSGDRYPERPASAAMADENNTAAPQAAASPHEEPRLLNTSDDSGQMPGDHADPSLAGDASRGAPPLAPSDGDPKANFAPPTGLTSNPKSGPENAPSASDEGIGRPGEQHLDGTQQPSLVIEKTAPREIQVGKPATFSIKVRNIGAATAQGVEVHDMVPKGTQLIETVPRANRTPQGELIWDLGAMKPGEESQVQVKLMPTSEGEIGSVATIHFHAEASVRTKATKPELEVDVSAPKQVMIGEEVVLKIKISNPGSGVATNVLLIENVPPGLKHAAGNELEFEIGNLRPGERRELELALTAAQAGPVTNVLMARSDASLQTEGRAQLEVIAPAIKVGISGAKHRYLERNATYTLSVSNPGTAPAKDIELVAVLPKELKFVQANNNGQYDAATRSVYWSLDELPPRENGSVTLTAMPLEPGELRLRVQARARQGLSDDLDETVNVEGLAAILFQLSDVNDPIELNGETTYEIHVVNQGSKAATNVRVVALLPGDANGTPAMKAISAEGPVRHVIEAQRVLFDPLAQLAPKADTTYSLKVQALATGDQRIRVQLLTDEMREPVTKEESTRVYSDE